MVMLNGKKEMFTATEVANLLNVHINTVRRWSNQGVLRTYRIGPRGDRRFSKGDLEQFLNHDNGNNGNGHSEPEVTITTIQPIVLEN